MTSPPGARSGAAAIAPRPIRSAVVEVVRIARDPRVRRVVGRPDDAALAGREPVDPAVDRELLAAQPARGSRRPCRPRRPPGVRYVRSSDIRVRWAPSEARTRRVSSTISPRIASASRIEVTRAAISRRVRSVSARREISSRDRPSSRISSALWMAIVARSARAASSAPCCSPNRPTSRREHRERAQHHGLADERRERDRPDAGPLEELAVGRAVGEAVVGGVLVGDDDPPLADREVDAGSADAEACHSARVASSMPASCAQRTSPVAGSSRSMTAPDDPSSRAASSTTSWSSSAGSWMVIIRRAISRSARSASAVRSRAPCEVARRSTRRALASATAAWPASASSSRSASSPNASRSRWPAWNTPTRPSSPMTGRRDHRVQARSPARPRRLPCSA